MKASNFFIPMLKESPRDAELISHQLMIRAGFIRQVGSGLYTWLPLGLRVLNKVTTIIRDELSQVGALELLMPAVQPADLWHKTERWDKYGDTLLKIIDRNEREYCFGPTHEEIITSHFGAEVKSYKQLPLTLFQIQTKFRDEIRPRFGVLRAREFLMKDAYSFHLDEDCLKNTYDEIYQAYVKIFKRLGLNVRAVLADTGDIGGDVSHEFQVIANSGEDIICYSEQSNYAANIEKAEVIASANETDIPLQEKIAVSTHHTSIKELSEAVDTHENKILKCQYGQDDQGKKFLFLLRHHHTINPIKINNLSEVSGPIKIFDDAAIRKHFNIDAKYMGPWLDECTIIADCSLINLQNFACGSGEEGSFYKNVNWSKDLSSTLFLDIRHAEAGDSSPDGQGKLNVCKGIEVGHIFQLGDTYTKKLDAGVLNTQGKKIYPLMGCYGLGVSRIVGAAIEQNHDDHGIIWPEAIAPFQIIIIPIQYHKDENIKKTAEELYQNLQKDGYEVMLDDRNLRPGVQFSEADLIGIPHRIVINKDTITNQTVEYKHRATPEPQIIDVNTLKNLLKN